jgi:predicted amidohydrolase YtcJ
MAFQGENFVARYGKEAALNAPPVKKMIDIGIKVGAGTDGTRVSSYNPWLTLYWLITGKTVGGKELMAMENKVDRLTALKLFTNGSASLINQDKSRGMLKPGFLADFVILNEDYLTVDAEKIKTLSSVLTVLNGKVVYGAEAFQDLAPQIQKAIPSWSPVNYYGGYQYE